MVDAYVAAHFNTLPHAAARCRTQEHAQRMLEAMVDYRIKCVEEPHNQALHYAAIVTPVMRDAAEQMDRAQQRRAAAAAE
jgi:hypothetical protein